MDISLFHLCNNFKMENSSSTMAQVDGVRLMKVISDGIVMRRDTHLFDDPMWIIILVTRVTKEK